eukprot:gene19664-biopygen2515
MARGGRRFIGARGFRPSHRRPGQRMGVHHLPPPPALAGAPHPVTVPVLQPRADGAAVRALALPNRAQRGRAGQRGSGGCATAAGSRPDTGGPSICGGVAGWRGSVSRIHIPACVCLCLLVFACVCLCLLVICLCWLPGCRPFTQRDLAASFCRLLVDGLCLYVLVFACDLLVLAWGLPAFASVCVHLLVICLCSLVFASVLLVFACGVLVRSCNSVRPHKQTQANTSKHKHSTSTQVFARSNRVLLVICLLQANTSMHKQTQADHKQIQAKTSSRRKTTGKHKQITSKHMQTQANASKHKQTTNKHKQAHADNQQTQADHKQTQAEHKQTQAHTSKDHPSFGTRHDTPIDA